jgi:hypothetical protein
MRLLLLAIGFACLAAGPSRAQTLGTPGTEIVFLVTDCTAAGHTLGTDCFEDIASLTTFLWDPMVGVQPTLSTPMLVDIGAGTFVGPLECPSGEGFVTFRGAGRDRTTIAGGSAYTSFFGTSTVIVDGCEKLGFQDLRILAEDGPAANYGVYWEGGGSSTWTDVDIDSKMAGWYDFNCGGDHEDPFSGLHYFWGSKIVAGEKGFYGECGQSWLYGSEVTIDVTLGEGTIGSGPAGINVAHRGDVRLIGSAVRVIGSDFPSSPAIVGVEVGPSQNSGSAPDGSGTFHMHGGVISVDASADSGIDIIGLLVDDDGDAGDAMAHVIETAFALKTDGGGDVARLAGDGHIHAPYLWEAHATEPVAGLESLTGQDQWVETDCDATGDCTGGGTPPLQPHLMIYSTNCGSNWFDVVMAACRP